MENGDLMFFSWSHSIFLPVFQNINNTPAFASWHFSSFPPPSPPSSRWQRTSPRVRLEPGSGGSPDHSALAGMCQTLIANAAYQQQPHRSRKSEQCERSTSSQKRFKSRMETGDVACKRVRKQRDVRGQVVPQRPPTLRCSSAVFGTQFRDWMYFLHMGGNWRV